MSEISKEKLKTEIEKILKDANLAKTSSKKVRQQLEKIFDTDLSDKRGEIDQLVMDYVNSKEDEEEEEEEEEETDEKEEVKEEEDEEEEEKEVKPKKSKGRKRKNSSDDSYEGPKRKTPKKEKKKGGGRGKGGGYTRNYKLSPALAELMGEPEMPRHEVVKRMWAIIKEKKLYDPNNKQFAICDDALYKVFGTKRFRTFGMMKYLKNHFLDD